MAKWWYLRKGTKTWDAKRQRYHDYDGCLFAAVLVGIRDELYYNGTHRGKWKNLTSVHPTSPCCWACGLPIDCSLAQVKRFYDKLEKETSL